MEGPGGCIDNEGQVPLRRVEVVVLTVTDKYPKEDPGGCTGSEGQVSLWRIEVAVLIMKDKYPDCRSRWLY